MRSRLLFVVAVLALVPAASSAGTIGLYPSTPNGFQDVCNFVEQGAGFRYVAVVIRPPILNSTYSGVSNLRIDTTQLQGWVGLEILSPYSVAGGPGLFSVSFGSCVSAPLVIAIASFFDLGATPCGRLSLLPGIGTPEPLITCDGTPEFTLTYGLVVNGVYNTPPGGIDPDCYCGTVATTPATWARVKSLYRK